MSDEPEDKSLDETRRSIVLEEAKEIRARSGLGLWQFSLRNSHEE